MKAKIKIKEVRSSLFISNSGKMFWLMEEFQMAVESYGKERRRQIKVELAAIWEFIHGRRVKHPESLQNIFALGVLFRKATWELQLDRCPS